MPVIVEIAIRCHISTSFSCSSHIGMYMVHPNEPKSVPVNIHVRGVLYTKVFTLLSSWECWEPLTWSSARVAWSRSITSGLTRPLQIVYDIDWMMGLSTKRVPAADVESNEKNIKGSHECYFTWLMSYDVAETETQKREKAALLAYNYHYGRK